MRTEKDRKIRQLITNIVIVILVSIGTYMTMTYRSAWMEFQMRGIMCLRYFTVQSNIFAGVVALVALFYQGKTTKVLKLMSATATGLTFAVVAFFLGPMYGYHRMYKHANLYFHLIVPLIAMIDFILLTDVPKKMKWKILSAMLTVLYGIGYILNILINGMGGRYPRNNDFYFFLRWGWGVAILIFAVIILLSFGIANLLCALNSKVGGGRKTSRPIKGETTA
ncbi:MAG: hypothetical protein VZR13_06605 [Saccharofermentanaceae bacterium]|nr:hypothetical protein [Saccharofermentanaceae bacterium]